MSTANITRELAAERTAGLRVSAYHVTIDLRGAGDEHAETCPVHCAIELQAGLERTWMDFLDGTVHRLVVNGQPQPVEHDGARFPVELEPGSNVVEVEAEARFSRSGQGLHRFFDPADGRCYLYTHFEPADARRLFPNFEQPDLKASHHWTVLAPPSWRVMANQRATRCEQLAPADGHPEAVRHVFAPTKRLSTYLTCMAAGEWHEATGSWQADADGEPLAVELAAYCRQSLVPHFDAEQILALTKQGLDWYHANFGHPYPWGKYHQVFVPEYNLGAMENPGLVTFTEAYLPRSAATRAQYQGRANTILHEMAHMWFGDLVTPAWWDDLWLKESFAEFMGAHVSVAATEFTDAWVAFAGRRKSWAYKQDQLPTTHPIVADIADVEAAKQNFDGITYAKGAAVLKQLVAHVGLEAFLAGSRAYFAQHAFGVARLDDLLGALQEASGRDLQAWSRAWLQTAGPDTLTPELELTDGTISRLAIHQLSLDARDQSPVGRPHTLCAGLYRREGSKLVRQELLEVELDGSPVTVVEQAAGLAAPDLVLVNDTDQSYAKIRFDDRSLATVLDQLSGIEDPLARALCWSALWDLTRDAELPATSYLQAVLRHGLTEPDGATMTDLLGQTRFAINSYLPAAMQDEASQRMADGVLAALRSAAPGSDAQLALARCLAALAARVTSLAPLITSLLDGSEQLEGLELGPELRWSLAHALTALGVWGEPELDAELTRDRTADGVTARLGALAARPLPEVKQQVWEQLHTPLALVNDHVDAMVAGFNEAGQQHLVAGFEQRYFEGLSSLWGSHSIEIAERLVGGLFPATPGAVGLADEWLQANPDAPAALRRLVIEGQDQQRRAQHAQNQYGQDQYGQASAAGS